MKQNRDPIKDLEQMKDRMLQNTGIHPAPPMLIYKQHREVFLKAARQKFPGLQLDTNKQGVIRPIIPKGQEPKEIQDRLALALWQEGGIKFV